jgi:hypothetical protein
VNDEEDGELLGSLLDRWEEADKQHVRLSAAELCGSRTDLIPELERLIEDLVSLKPLESTDSRGGRPAVGSVEASPLFEHEQYRLKGKLGHGAEGDVWLGWDERLKRDVAVKLPRQESESLLEEARLIAQLRHPHVLKVFDCGRDKHGHAFIVTELMQGQSLWDRLRAGNGRIRPATAVRWAVQIAHALAALHQYRYVHRDIKPANILFDGHENAILADFGIALNISDEAATTSRGSPGYKSPEQRRSASIDARSDIFSLAVVFHEMLSGSLPFRSDQLDQVCENREATIPKIKLSAKVPARLRPLLRSSLATDPADRPPSASDFAAAIERDWRRSRFGTWVGRAALAAVFGLVLLGWRARQQHLANSEQLEAQTRRAEAVVREATDIFKGSQRKLGDVQELGRRIVDESMNDPFHRARRAESEARRGATAASTDE